MYQIKKHLVLVVSIVIIITAVVTYTILGMGRKPTEIIVDEAAHKLYLDTFLEGKELISVAKEKNDFFYYELQDAYGDGQGFIFLGEEEGYIGPIKLFVKTDLEGTIQKVHVWQHSETPIYVPPVPLKEFLRTFANHKIDANLKWQTDIHGLTGATVTAESIIKAVSNLGEITKEKDIYNVP